MAKGQLRSNREKKKPKADKNKKKNHAGSLTVHVPSRWQGLSRQKIFLAVALQSDCRSESAPHPKTVLVTARA